MATEPKLHEQLGGLAEESTQSQLRILTEILNSVTEPILLIDSEGRVTFGNQSAIIMLEVSHESLVNQFVANFAHNDLSITLTHLTTDRKIANVAIKVVQEIESDSDTFRVLRLEENGRVVQPVLSRLAGEISSGKPLAEVLDSVTAAVLECTQADHASITLLDRNRSNFEIITEHPRNPENRFLGIRIPITGFPVQELLRDEKKPIVAPQIRHHEFYLESPSVRNFTARLGTKSILVVPMVLRDRVIGTVSIDYTSRSVEFKEKDIQLLTTIAEYSAIAIENAQLFERNRGMQQTQFLHDLSVPSTQEGLLEAVADRLLGELATIVEFNTASLQIFGKERRILSAHGFDKNSASRRTLMHTESDSLVRCTLESGNVTIVGDTHCDKRWVPEHETADVRSWIGIPFNLQDAPQFLITLDHDEPNHYDALTAEEVAHLDSFQQRAGTEIENFYLRRRIESLSVMKRFEELSESSSGKDSVVNGVVQELCRSFHCSHASVYLETPGTAGLTRAGCEGDCDIHGVTARLEQLGRRSYGLAETVVIDDLWAEFSGSTEIHMDSCAAIATPIWVGHEPIGVVVIYHDHVNTFGGADRFMLEIIARQVGTALDRSTRLETVQELSESILDVSTSDRVLDVLASGIGKMTRMDCVVYRLSKDNLAITHRYHTGATEHPEPRLDVKTGLTWDLIQDRRPIEIGAISKDDRVNPFLVDRYKTITGIPLVFEDSVLGVLYLNGTRLLTVNEKTFVIHMANLACIVIQRLGLLEDLHLQKAHYESLVNNMRQCVTEKDTDGVIIFANHAFCRSVGSSIDDVVGKNDYDFYDRELADEYRKIDQKVMRKRETCSREEKHRRPGAAQPTWVKVVKSPVINQANGKVTGVHVVFWDITAEKMHRQRYESLVDQSPDGIVSHTEGVIQFANTVAAQLFGFEDASHIVGEHIHDFIHDDDRLFAEGRLRTLLDGGDVERTVELRLRGRGEKSIPVELTSQLGPAPGEVQVVIHDLSRVRRVLDEMHHRVMRVLNIVQLQLESYKEQSSPRTIESVQYRVLALALAHRILYEDRGRTEICMQSLLTELASSLHEAYVDEAKPVVIDVDANLFLPERLGEKCGLVVGELLSNSLLHAFSKCEPEHRARVNISVVQDRDMIRLVVNDNGIGCSIDFLANAQSMGLQLVRDLVRKDLRGSIEFSVANGVSATAVFQLT